MRHSLRKKKMEENEERFEFATGRGRGRGRGRGHEYGPLFDPNLRSSRALFCQP